MNSLAAYPSKAKLFGLLLLNVLMVSGCVFCITLPDLMPKIVGVIGVAFFGLGFITIPKALFHTATPKIVMNERGIHSGPWGPIEWEDIVGFRIDSIKNTKFISVFVKDKNKYLDRMSPLLRKSVQIHSSLGLSEFTLSFVGLSPGLPEACTYLNELGYDIEKM